MMGMALNNSDTADLKTNATALVLVFACALAVRVVVVTVHCGGDSFAQHDAHSELVWVARNLTADRGFSSPFGPGDAATAWFSPLLPFLWSGVMHVVGDGDRFIAVIQQAREL